MQDDELTLRLDDQGEGLKLTLLVESVQQFFKTLQLVDEELRSTADTTVSWQIVRIKKRSPLTMTVRPIVQRKGRRLTRAGKEVVRSTMDGLQGLREGSADPRFGPDFMNTVKRFAETAVKQNARVEISTSDRRKAMLDDQTLATIQRIEAEQPRYTDFSSIEGMLELVSVHDRPYVCVWETLTNQRVQCRIADDQKQLAAKLLGKRVSVRGKLLFKNHIPVRMDEGCELMELVDPGIDPRRIRPINITGGLSSEEFIRRGRNG